MKLHLKAIYLLAMKAETIIGIKWSRFVDNPAQIDRLPQSNPSAVNLRPTREVVPNRTFLSPNSQYLEKKLYL